MRVLYPVFDEGCSGEVDLASRSPRALGRRLVSALAGESHMVRNLAERPYVAANLASPEPRERVGNLAPFSSTDPMPEKQAVGVLVQARHVRR